LKAAFARYDPAKQGVYSFEARPDAFPPELEAAFREHPEAWSSSMPSRPGTGAP
jgi:hypothetical protein